MKHIRYHNNRKVDILYLNLFLNFIFEKSIESESRFPFLKIHTQETVYTTFQSTCILKKQIQIINHRLFITYDKKNHLIFLCKSLRFGAFC